MENLAHRSPLHAGYKNAPSNPVIKQQIVGNSYKDPPTLNKVAVRQSLWLVPEAP
ncbi:hypothetical protein MAE02_64660 [Microvirga aerophila]|uniref:Uncharacterized protein n=1 Tax=Microvirga aerophila TaxID=670291 RepID=A0A512C3J0_9HYPH|nr:hypothetical protein MAE02_64660 [Microvirga aerophila]